MKTQSQIDSKIAKLSSQIEKLTIELNGLMKLSDNSNAEKRRIKKMKEETIANIRVVSYLKNDREWFYPTGKIDLSCYDDVQLICESYFGDIYLATWISANGGKVTRLYSTK